jgi:hypothetical protein
MESIVDDELFVWVNVMVLTYVDVLELSHRDRRYRPNTESMIAPNGFPFEGIVAYPVV